MRAGRAHRALSHAEEVGGGFAGGFGGAACGLGAFDDGDEQVGCLAGVAGGQMARAYLLEIEDLGDGEAREGETGPGDELAERDAVGLGDGGGWLLVVEIGVKKVGELDGVAIEQRGRKDGRRRLRRVTVAVAQVCVVA